MKLSLTDAARALGRSPRQIRYAIRTGQLRAEKVAGRWIVDQADLPLTDGQRRARQRRAVELQETVHAALGPHLRPAGSKTYSVRDLIAFTHNLAACREAARIIGEDAPAAHALRDALVSLSRACHRYHARQKGDGFRDAREQASAAVAHLYLLGSAPAEALAFEIERELLPALSGLLRRAEREERK